MSALPPIREGFVPFRGHRTWYRVVGGEVAGRLPLILLNGGPRMPHDYLEPLAEWARGGRQIVFYDQLGSGDSDDPRDPGLWTVELFVDEQVAVREALGLAHCHLLGRSWGGLLAVEHALAHPHECTPAIQEDLHRRLPGSEWVVFEESAHVPHLEEPERFREVVERFLACVERGAAQGAA